MQYFYCYKTNRAQKRHARLWRRIQFSGKDRITARSVEVRHIGMMEAGLLKN
jgi:hypothetical protein